MAKEEASFKGKLLKAKALEKKGRLEASKAEEEETKSAYLHKKVRTRLKYLTSLMH